MREIVKGTSQKRWCVALGGLLLALTAAAPPAARAAKASADPRGKVVVLAIEGAGAEELARRQAAGDLSERGFARLAELGQHASKVKVRGARSPSAALVTLVTGASPPSTTCCPARPPAVAAAPRLDVGGRPAARRGDALAVGACLVTPGGRHPLDRRRQPLDESSRQLGRAPGRRAAVHPEGAEPGACRLPGRTLRLRAGTGGTLVDAAQGSKLF
ncbi:MAG: hypothetical protein R2862_03150 [Thermoanaerobaculia bacterium]